MVGHDHSGGGEDGGKGEEVWRRRLAKSVDGEVEDVDLLLTSILKVSDTEK